MAQPSGLRGLRHAKTKPTTPKPAEIHTGKAPPLASAFWCASRASGTLAIAAATTRPPRTSAVTDDARRMRLTDRTVRRHRSETVTATAPVRPIRPAYLAVPLIDPVMGAPDSWLGGA